jgi:hypothetical protein
MQHTRSSVNILTQLPHNNSGINVTSLLPDYIHCIGQQLRQALNDPSQLGIIYQGLAKYIAAMYKGSLHLSKFKQQTCTRSPIARTFFYYKENTKYTLPPQSKHSLSNPLNLNKHGKTIRHIPTSRTNPKSRGGGTL